MKLSKFLSLSILCLAAVCFSACKDDDDTDTTPTLEGSVSFGTIPDFLAGGESFEFTVTGPRRPDKGGIGICWSCNPFHTDVDTIRLESESLEKAARFSIKIPTDTACAFSITVKAFAKGYYPISGTLTSQIVRPGINTGSIKGFALDGSEPTFTDSRDGKVYLVTTIGSLQWFRQNLAYETFGEPYCNSPAAAELFGHYYSWTEAQSVCPSGWRLPSEDDWHSLASALGKGSDKAYAQFDSVAGDLMVDAIFCENKMWEYWPKIKLTDKAGFSAMPTGYAEITESAYLFKTDSGKAVYWTSDESKGQGVYRYITAGEGSLFAGSADKNAFAASVRCVKDI